MKRIISCLLFVLIFIKANAQAQIGSAAEFQQFLKTKTYVVYEENPFSGFNMVIKDFMNKYWKVTPFAFIEMKEFDVKKTDPNCSFIIITDAVLTKNKLFNTEIKYQYTYTLMNLILGKKMALNNKDISSMPDLGSVPLSYSEVEEDSYLYKIAGMLNFMQYYVKYNIEHPGSDYKAVVKANAGEIKTKELWLIKEDLANNVNSLEKIKKIYPYSVKIVTEEELEKAIEDANPNVAFFHKVGPEGTATDAICWKFIISAKEGKPLYYDYHKVSNDNPDALLMQDLKDLAK